MCFEHGIFVFWQRALPRRPPLNQASVSVIDDAATRFPHPAITYVPSPCDRTPSKFYMATLTASRQSPIPQTAPVERSDFAQHALQIVRGIWKPLFISCLDDPSKRAPAA